MTHPPLSRPLGVVVLALAALLPSARRAHGDCFSAGPIPLPNVVWGLQDAVSACPAGDSVLAGHPARLRIGVHYEDAFCNARVGVPPESVWVTYSPLSGTNLKVNDQGVKIFADDSTNANGDARITIPSFSGCGRLRVYLFVSGVAQGNKLAYVRTTDTNADGRVTAGDDISPCDLDYSGGFNLLDVRLVDNHLDDWHRNALHGTLVRRTNLSYAENQPGAIGESQLFWSPSGRWLSYTIHGPSGTKCHVFLVPSSPPDRRSAQAVHLAP